MNILQTIKNKLSQCIAVAFVTYKEWSAYRTHSLVSIFVGPIYFIIQYFIWTAVYGSNDNLAGMQLEQTIKYFGASALIGYLTMDFADWNLQMLVRTGKFLSFALRPIHHRFFALSQKLGHRILGFTLEFIPCFLIFMFLFKIDIMPENILWTTISIILAFLMNFYINYTLGMTAFFFVRSEGIRVFYQLLSSVFAGALIPLNFFPNIIQKIMMFLPFQYTNYIPSMVWTGVKKINGNILEYSQIILLQALALFIMIFLSEFIYKLSMKRFTAVGA